jgi:hypothetical protein
MIDRLPCPEEPEFGMTLRSTFVTRALALLALVAISACMTSSTRSDSESEEAFAVLTAWFDN